MISLATISIERYVKVVHPQWSKKKFFKRLKYSAAAFAWIFSIMYMFAISFPTTIVLDGACYPYYLFMDDVARVIQFLTDFFFFYLFVNLTCIFSYWRILIVIRRQARVMAAHSTAGSSTGQAQSNQIETSVIKTMILVTAFYAISFMPYYISALHANLNPTFVPTYSSHGVSVFATFLYTCTNPFIYATSFNPVKKVLLDKLSCKKIRKCR